MKYILTFLFVSISIFAQAQADNEIQVYASPTIQHKWTIFELHSNYTCRGSKYLSDPKLAHWTNETLEITHGFGKNFEIGFYFFTGFAPEGGGYQYQGNHIRPRVTIPQEWKWKIGASLSAEFGFFRATDSASFVWEGEIRPIFDKTFNNWYFAFNPNIDFVLSGDSKQWGISPQFKTVYTIQQKWGLGFEYYGSLGTFRKLLPWNQQEHLLGPMIDLYLWPLWEVSGGMLFGLNNYSNQRILKLILGKRIAKN